MKIGFADYYISEWHANNYPKYIAEMCENFGYGAKVAYAWAELGVSPVDGVDTDTWCKRFGVLPCADIDELCEKSDAIIILAPSNPEKHLEYAKAVFKHKKPTYIDKTFAQDLDTAKEIFELAQRYGVKFFSTSALRFADELALVKEPVRFCTTGGGSKLEEYVIHQIEMAVTVMGEGFDSVTYQRQDGTDIFELTRSDGRSAKMSYRSDMGFAYTATLTGGEEIGSAARSPYFKNLMAKILDFFATGALPFDSNQTLEVIRIRDTVLDAVKNENVKIKF